MSVAPSSPPDKMQEQHSKFKDHQLEPNSVKDNKLTEVLIGVF